MLVCHGYCHVLSFAIFVRLARLNFLQDSTINTTKAPRRNSATDIRATLQQEIEHGSTAPGALLDERALAERFGVSRTPIREALQQLAALDLVRIVPRHGVFVSKLSIPQLRAQLELLCELEAVSARLAARRMNQEEQAALQQAAADCVAADTEGDSAAFLRANYRFHRTIYQGSHNIQLAETIVGIRRLVQRYRPQLFASAVRRQQAIREHDEVCQAILAGNEAAAYQAMLSHAPSGSTGFAEFLSMLPPHMLNDDIML